MVKLYYFVLFSLLVIIGCGNDSENVITPNVKYGSIFGTVIDKETGEPIVGASIDIEGKIASTDSKGKYTIKDIPMKNNMNVIVSAENYVQFKGIVSLQQELLAYNVSLNPLQSPYAPILAVLDSISKNIESLDPTKIPVIQSHFTKDYSAGDDEATAFAIFAGVVPPNFNAIPDTIQNIIKKYKKIKFEFANPEVKLSGDTAVVLMRFIVSAETNPPEPKLWDIVIDGKMNFQKQDNDWKMSFWGLIPPFLKFEEKPL